jgi:hypothetical protein
MTRKSGLRLPAATQALAGHVPGARIGWKSALPGVRGNGITSRMLAMPVA